MDACSCSIARACKKISTKTRRAISPKQIKIGLRSATKRNESCRLILRQRNDFPNARKRQRKMAIIRKKERATLRQRRGVALPIRNRYDEIGFAMPYGNRSRNVLQLKSPWARIEIGVPIWPPHALTKSFPGALDEQVAKRRLSQGQSVRRSQTPLQLWRKHSTIHSTHILETNPAQKRREPRRTRGQPDHHSIDPAHAVRGPLPGERRERADQYCSSQTMRQKSSAHRSVRPATGSPDDPEGFQTQMAGQLANIVRPI